jgi:arginyl-tRNA synthetase
MQTLRDTLSSLLAGAIARAFPGADIPSGVLPATRPEFGDAQWNGALAASKLLRKPPRAIAEAILAELPLGGSNLIAKAEIAGPGFLNLTLSPAALASWLDELSRDPFHCVPQEGAGERYLIDYSSPNVAKPMHIAHIRSTVIGDALKRIHRALGREVLGDNHLGDWGTQFGILIMGYRHFLDPAALADSPVDELQRLYVLSHAKADEDPAWKDACRAELVKLQQGDPDNLALWEKFISLSMAEFNRVYDRLGVTFEMTRGESYYRARDPEIAAMLEEKGLARESDGALVAFFDGDADPLPPCIIRKSDGGYNYAASDLATVFTRNEDFSPTAVLYVTDERQQLHFRQFFRLAEKAGNKTPLFHVWFGLMRLPEGLLSTRNGRAIKLEKLLDEAERRAKELVDAASPSLPEEERAAIAKAVGIGAVKYADLSQNPQSAVSFTWEKALSMDGNSAPYLQYACARARSIAAKHRERFPGEDAENAAILLDAPQEKALVLAIARVPEAVREAARLAKPSALAEAIYALAGAYSAFYQALPCLRAEDAATRASRVRLCLESARMLSFALGLLGIETPERI